MAAEPNKIIYSMVGVGKFYDKKPVLKDIYLSYFYGAKIGVLGLNGSGKSSLLRIMAGTDKEFVGEVVVSAGLHRRHSRTGAEARSGEDRAPVSWKRACRRRWTCSPSTTRSTKALPIPCPTTR